MIKVRYDDNKFSLICTNNLYRRSKILKLDDMFRFQFLKFINGALYHDESLFESAFTPLVPQHSHKTKDVRFLLPPVRLEIERALPFSCVKYFNELPDEFKQDCSKLFLKIKYRDFILNQC
jgi:hypothetical protein